ncbi:regulatory protein, luxR family [Streptacidiphilus jiangxiensis]|uniref:Regulatory protein, luxR family n=2 Tax=Streptacidiphilus jiangxiensis TaxID=235985 RepID=A0A1H7NXJ6_STRJI|nr:regulatory protein, luxR family [Streptacidiphilus jiangxiensis]
MLDAVGALLDRLRAEPTGAATGPETGAVERTLLVLGEPGLGKTSVLEAAATLATEQGGQVRWVVGRQAEAGLAYSGLHALLDPWQPGPAGADEDDASLLHAALRGGAGEGAGQATGGGVPAPAGALVRLLSRWAQEGPLLVVVDDLQWLDRSTQDLLTLCARRLAGEPIGFVVASRPAGLADAWVRQSTVHRLDPLDEIHSARLLDSLPRAPEGRVRRQVLRLAGGNPLALIELARTSTGKSFAQDPAGSDLPLGARLERLYAADLDALPGHVRAPLLLAAVADPPDLAALGELFDKAVLECGQDAPTLHPARTHDAARTRGEETPAAADPRDVVGPRAETVRPADAVWSVAERAGLLVLRAGQLRFRHPLIRSAVLSAATFEQRARAHLLLAANPDLDEDRRAWHRAAATVTADESVAAALEATADRARRRGGHPAAATTMERAAQLSPRTEDRVRRLGAAAEFAMLAGQPLWVAELTAEVAALADTPEARAHADLHAGWALALTSRHAEAMDHLLAASDAYARTRPALAVPPLGTATMVAFISGEPRFRAAVLDRYRALPPQEPDYASTWILAGCDPFGARREALRHLREAAARSELPLGAWSMLGAAAWALDETDLAVQYYGSLLERYRQSATSGANATVSSAHALALFESGRWAAALAGVSEAEQAAAAGGLEIATLSTQILAAVLAAVRGDADRARRVLAEATRDVDLRGTRNLDARVRQAHALAALAGGDHQAAWFHLSRLFHPDSSPVHFHTSLLGLGDLAAAAVRVDGTARAREILHAVHAVHAELPSEVSPRLRLILCRARGLLAADEATAEEQLREAAFTPAGDQWPFERARALADLGEWLRRRQRPADARLPLGEARELFQGLGAIPWAARTAAELRAAGVDTAPARSTDLTMELTPQQLAIVRLAAQGLSNKEIGERLFLSSRTVGFHLSRAFPKLGVTSRFQLRDVVAQVG